VINKTIALLDVVGFAVRDFARNTPKTAYAAFMVFALMMVGQSAQAAPLSPPLEVDDPSNFIGCPSLAWAQPLQGTSQNISGMVIGLFIVVVLFVMLLSGVILALSGNRRDRAAGAIEGAKNAGLGAVIVLIGVPIVTVVIWGIATLFNPSCTA